MTARAFLLSVGTPIALVALYAAMQEPALYLYYAAIALVLVAGGGYGAAYRFRDERDNARNEARRAGEERDAIAVERDIANELVDRLRADLRAARPLRVVPAQRDGGHDDLPVADESWLDEITKPGGWA